MVEEKKQEPEKQKKPRKRSFLRVLGSVIGWLFVVGLMGVLFAGGAVAGYVTSIVENEPVRSRALIENTVNDNAITGFAYFADGSPIGQLRTEEDRRPVEFKDIPQLVKDAVVSIEDNRFYTHKGVDIKGTARAVKERVLNEPVQTGGSTLTQQLARLTFLSRDKTDNRKVKEMLLAMRMERFLSKDQILTAYLNKVPYGNGSSGYQLFGIKAAAKGIFNINKLDDLNVAQAAYLAGLPQLPSSYSAFNGKGEFDEKAFNRAVNRQHRVLASMLEEGKITQAEYEEAKAFDIKKSLAPRTQKAYVTYPYLMMEVERQASNILMQLSEEAEENAKGTQANSDLMDASRAQLSTGGYRVYTTIDRTLYKTMRSIAEDDSNYLPDSQEKGMEQTAAMMIDNKTGAILGMIEGRDFNTEQMNYATQMKRQPGSAMKPIAAYLPALDSGGIQPASVVDDSPIILKDYSKVFHIPKNSYSGYRGLMTARQALNDSTNTVALKLFNNTVGIEKAWEFSKKLGITTLEEDDYNASTGVLGGLHYGVTVEELTNAYSSIGNQGKFTDAFMIEKIVDSKGNIVYKHEVKPEQVFSEQTAYLMTDMLRTVITNGTGSKVRDTYKKFNEVPVVGKTGSTQNYGDVWFMGYSPDVTLGVWVGYKEQKNTLVGDQRKHAQAIWARIMNEATDVKPDLFPTKTFEKPEGITSKTVSAYSGKLPTALTDRFVTDLFNVKFVPTESDDGIAKAKYITYRGVNYIPQEATPLDMLREQIVIKREKPIDELIIELQNALKVMKGEKRSLESYLPQDAKKGMPSRLDPRTDDGKAPTPPKNVHYSMGSGSVSFNASGSPDVVGYRLFKSVNGSPYTHQGQVVLGDESLVFSGLGADGMFTSYYVVAVDVAGKVSEPSAIVGGTAPGFEVPGDNEANPENDIDNPGDGVTEGEPDIDLELGNKGAATVPSAPGQPTLVATPEGFQATWSGNAPEEEVMVYNIYISPNSDGNYQILGSSKSTEFYYSSGNPIGGTFRVTAVNPIGESAASPAVYFEKK